MDSRATELGKGNLQCANCIEMPGFSEPRGTQVSFADKALGSSAGIYAALDAARAAVAVVPAADSTSFQRTETSLLTPGSCIVTP
jgi:hypothetical protein